MWIYLEFIHTQKNEWQFSEAKCLLEEFYNCVVKWLIVLMTECTGLSNKVTVKCK